MQKENRPKLSILEIELLPVTDAGKEINLADLAPQSVDALAQKLNKQLGLDQNTLRLAVFTDWQKLMVGAYVWDVTCPEPEKVAASATAEIYSKLGLAGENATLSEKDLKNFCRGLVLKVGTDYVPLQIHGPVKSIEGIKAERKQREKESTPSIHKIKLHAVDAKRARLSVRTGTSEKSRNVIVRFDAKSAVTREDVHTHLMGLFTVTELEISAVMDSNEDLTVDASDLISAITAAVHFAAAPNPAAGSL